MGTSAVVMTGGAADLSERVGPGMLLSTTGAQDGPTVDGRAPDVHSATAGSPAGTELASQAPGIGPRVGSGPSSVLQVGRELSLFS